MVGQPERHRRLIDEVAALYAWIDEQLAAHQASAGRCRACGSCCDFAAYDHLLFVTPPELIYLAANLGTDRLESMPSGRCPYQRDSQCMVRSHRFAACRIFCCQGDANFQSDLTEAALKRLKTMCEQFEIPYRYAELATALASFANDTGRSAGGPCPGDRAS